MVILRLLAGAQVRALAPLAWSVTVVFQKQFYFGGLSWREEGREGKMLTALVCCAGSVWSCWGKNDLTPGILCFWHVSAVGAFEELGSTLRDKICGIQKTRVLLLGRVLSALH